MTFPKDLEYYLDAECTKRITEDSIEFGEWDIALGAEFIIYLKNPYDYAKAILNLNGSDPRVINEFPKELKPYEVGQMKVTIPARDFDSEDEERAGFTDLFHQISGSIKWVRA